MTCLSPHGNTEARRGSREVGAAPVAQEVDRPLELSAAFGRWPGPAPGPQWQQELRFWKQSLGWRQLCSLSGKTQAEDWRSGWKLGTRKVSRGFPALASEFTARMGRGVMAEWGLRRPLAMKQKLGLLLTVTGDAPGARCRQEGKQRCIWL